MANLGAEVSRIFSARDARDEKQIEECFERAQKIINEVMAIPDMKARGQEIELLRDAIYSISESSKEMSAVSKKNLMGYFTPFALRLMAITS